MPFPQVERVIYGKNPLDTVVCQVRFPSILKIDVEVPSLFQDKLGKEYLNFKETQEMLFDIQFGGRPGTSIEEIKNNEPTLIKNFEFASEDNNWKVNLTRNFMALSTTHYVRWEEFRRRFNFALGVLINVYNPTIFTRIGLRYKDVIIRSKLRLSNVDWNDLINPPFLGILAPEDIKDSVKQFQSTFVIGLKDDEGLVKVTTGTVKTEHSPEICFMIDSDFYELKRRTKEEILIRLDYFNSKALSLFRWCITEKLHKAMGPKEVR